MCIHDMYVYPSYIGEAANIQSVSVKDVVGNLTDGQKFT